MSNNNNIWKNSNEQKFEIQPVSPFLEEEVRSSTKWPDPPFYRVTQLDTDGNEFHQIYQHTDDTMTEPCTIDDDGIIKNIYNEPRRWVDDATAQEKRAWRAYKAASQKADNEFVLKLGQMILCHGIVESPSDEWKVEYIKQMGGHNIDELSLKYAYILREVIASEDDLQSLSLAIQEIRQIRRERIDLYKNSFRNQSKREAA